MKAQFFLLLLYLLASCNNTSAEMELLKVDVSKDIVVPKSYVVSKITDTITIDGLADEAAWKYAAYTEKFIDIEGVKKVAFNTKVKMLWDKEYLYVYSELEEPHIWGYLRERDTIIFYNNDFEVFIDPSSQNPAYGEIELNVLNTVWDLKLDKAYRTGGTADNSWNIEGLQSAIKIYGSLNDASDTDSLWAIEMAIPFKPLLKLDKLEDTTVKDGTIWRINFSRVEWDFELKNGKYYRKQENNAYLPEYNWVWSNQKVINMHEPEKWGYLQFSDSSSTKDVIFNRNKNEELIQAAYALYRKILNGKLKYLRTKKSPFSQIIKLQYKDSLSASAIFNSTDNGYTISINDSINASHIIINSDGTYKILSK